MRGKVTQKKKKQTAILIAFERKAVIDKNVEFA